MKKENPADVGISILEGFSRLGLPHKELFSEYYQLSVHTDLSEAEEKRIDEILFLAEEDGIFAELLSKVDQLVYQKLDTKISQDHYKTQIEKAIKILEENSKNIDEDEIENSFLAESGQTSARDTRIQSILIDENLLWDVLLERYASMESMGFIWNLITSGCLKGYITDVAFDEIWRNAYLLKGEEVADQLVSSLSKVLECKPVERSTMQSARSLNLRFSAAVKVLCGLELQVDGILTSNPLDFCQSEFSGMSIFTPDLFIFKHLERKSGDMSADGGHHAVTSDSGSVLLTAGGRLNGQSVWGLEQLEVCCGVKEPSATVVVQTAEAETLRATATGNGPIDAAYKAIKKSFEQCAVPDHQLVYTATQATTADSEVSVTILLQAGDTLFPGRGFHTDIVWAYVYAYIDAVDYMLCHFSKKQLTLPTLMASLENCFSQEKPALPTL